MHLNQIIPILALSAAAALMGGCKADRFKAIQLIAPAANSEVEPRNVAFTWDTKDEGPVRFILATAGFKDILLDTTLSGNALTYPHTLSPDSAYIWQLEQGEHIQSSTFEVVDIAARFSGHYSGEAVLTYFSDVDTPMVSRHIAAIDIAKDGTNMKVTGDRQFSVPLYDFTDSTLVFANPFLHQNRYLTLDFVHNTIMIWTTDGGLGGEWRYWLMIQR